MKVKKIIHMRVDNEVKRLNKFYTSQVADLE